jgi:hypothetical protein
VDRHDAVFLDTNVIIEAIRTHCWAAITGHLRTETVEACRTEAATVPTRPGRRYVRVTEEALQRIRAIHPVSDLARASLKLTCPEAADLDPGEQNLLAHAVGRTDQVWSLCSPDKAFIRAAMVLGMGDRLISLEQLAALVGVKPRPPLRRHFSTDWLVSFRTKVRLER